MRPTTPVLFAFVVLSFSAACAADDDDSVADTSGATTITSASSASTAGSTATATATTDPSASDAETTDVDESEDGGTCDGPDEPNDELAQATELPDAEDCDSQAEAMGVLDGDADVDWFVYAGTDTLGCEVDPTRDVIATGAVRFCKFARCLDGNASVGACPAGTISAATDDGDPGCCSQSAPTTNFAIAPECSGVDDSLEIYMRVDNGPADSCASYTISYHF